MRESYVFSFSTLNLTQTWHSLTISYSFCALDCTSMKPLDYTHSHNQLITKYGPQYGNLKIESWRIWNLGIRLVIKEPILIHEVLIPPPVYIIGLWRALHSASSHKLYHRKSEADYRQKMMRIWYDETRVSIHSTKSNGRIASNPKLIFLTTLLHMNQKLQQSHPYTVTPSRHQII